MPLPKIATPTYELVLPSTGKKIKYRPFLVKEEKILILALESQDSKQITTAIKSTLKSCIQTRGIKVEELPTFDIEYIFLNIRGKSVGESVDVIVTCPDDGETTVETQIFLDEIQVQKNEKHNRDIVLDQNLTLRMKYPSLDEFIKNNFDVSGANDITFEASLDIIASCIDVVYNEDESWAASDCTKKELGEWLETLNSNQFKQVETFFETMPKLSHTVKVVNPKTKIESDVTLEGITSFFG
jgi:hypothetical protein